MGAAPPPGFYTAPHLSISCLCWKTCEGRGAQCAPLITAQIGRHVSDHDQPVLHLYQCCISQSTSNEGRVHPPPRARALKHLPLHPCASQHCARAVCSCLRCNPQPPPPLPCPRTILGSKAPSLPAHKGKPGSKVGRAPTVMRAVPLPESSRGEPLVPCVSTATSVDLPASTQPATADGGIDGLVGLPGFSGSRLSTDTRFGETCRLCCHG